QQRTGHHLSSLCPKPVQRCPRTGCIRGLVSPIGRPARCAHITPDLEMEPIVISDLAQIAGLSREWKINEEDILLIALNSSGVRSHLDKPRMRFRLRLDSRPDDQLYLILSLGRMGSPFELDEHEIRLAGRRIGVVDALEDDDAVLGYWRHGNRVLTLNSNARSQC